MVSITSVFVADDHRVVRAGLRLLLARPEDMEVVGEAGDVEAMLRGVLGHKPAVLVLDLTMPGELSPLEALPLVSSRSPLTRTVVLTMQDDPSYAQRALASGALGYVLKEAAESELVEAVRRAARGERYLTPSLGARLAALGDRGGDDERLTRREREVLRLVALGHTSSDIAERLVISPRTVESHRAHIQRKLGLTSRAELVRHALDAGMLEDPGDAPGGALPQ